MSIVTRVEEQGKQLERIEKALKVRGEKDKKIKIKIPKKFVRASKKDGNVSVALVLHKTNKAEFKKAVYKDGLIYVGEDFYSYDPSGVFHLKNTPFIVVLTWRLLVLGGEADRLQNVTPVSHEVTDQTTNITTRVLVKNAEVLKIENAGAQTIIRGIENAELDKDKKKSGGMSIIWWILGGVAVLYVVAQFFTGAA